MNEAMRLAHLLAPRYVSRFACWQGECPDTCCFGWDVFVDRETYEKYQGVMPEGVRIRLVATLVPVTDDPGGRPAKVCAADSGKACGLISGDSRCMLWQELGEAALPLTCKTYPRVVQGFGDRLEQTLNLSCPAAARLALQDADAFDFVEAELPVPPGDIGVVAALAGIDLGTMDDARMLALQLLQTDGLSNVERLLTLGILCDHIDRQVAAGEQAGIAAALAEIVDFVESGEAASVALKIPDEFEHSGSVFAMLTGSLLGAARSEHQRATLGEVLAGLGGEASATDAAAIGRCYAQARAALTPAAAAEIEEVLRRFLLNELLRGMFPWGSSGAAMKQYRFLVLLFGGLRLCLTGAAAASADAFDRERATQVTQVFCRLTTHNPAFFARAERLMAGANFDSLGNLCQLVK